MYYQNVISNNFAKSDMSDWQRLFLTMVQYVELKQVVNLKSTKIHVYTSQGLIM